MKIDKFSEIKKQDWYDYDWVMEPYLWKLLEQCYFTDKVIKEIHAICWEGMEDEKMEEQRGS